MLQGNHSYQQQVWLPDRRKRKPQRKEKAYCLLLQGSLEETCLERSLGNLLTSPLTYTKREQTAHTDVFQITSSNRTYAKITGAVLIFTYLYQSY